MFGEKIKEECGIYGIYGIKNHEDVVTPICVGLSGLQHRGEESCGIAVNEDGIIHFHKDLGLVSDVFTKNIQKYTYLFSHLAYIFHYKFCY